MNHYNEEGWRKVIRKGNYQETLVAMKSLKAKHKTLIDGNQGRIVECLKNNGSSHRHSSNLTCAIVFLFSLLYEWEAATSFFFVRWTSRTWEFRLEDKHYLKRSELSDPRSILKIMSRVNWSAKKWQITLET